jgi:hypothetical protein
VDLRRGAGGLGVPVWYWRRRRGGRVVGHNLDPQVVAAVCRELEVPSHGDRVCPWILGTPAAEDAPREIESDVAAFGVETLRECTRWAD